MYTDSELLNDIERCHEKHGEIKHSLLDNDDELATSPTIVNRFGSIQQAVEESDLDTTYNNGNYTNEEIQDVIREKQNERGYISTSMLREDNSLPSINTLVNRFGSLSNAREELGMETVDKRSSVEDSFCDLEEVGYESAEVHTYTISVSNGNTAGLYVGVTTNLLRRLVVHRSIFSGAMPLDGRLTTDNSYQMIGIVDITPHKVDTEDSARLAEIERRYFIEQVRKFDTNNIAGGK